MSGALVPRPRHLLLAALAAAVLVPVADAAAAATLAGTYRTTVTGSGPLNGAWTITFDRGGYAITFKGARAVAGRYTLAGSRAVLTDRSGPLACTGAGRTGTYTVARSGRRLTLTAVRDACVGRKAVLSGRALTRAPA